MAVAGSLQLSYNLGLCKNQGTDKQFKIIVGRSNLALPRNMILSRALFQQDRLWSTKLLGNMHKPVQPVPSRGNAFKCHSSLVPGQPFGLPTLKASMALMRSFQSSPLIFKLAPAVGIIVFAAWGLGPLIRRSRNLLLNKNDNSWKKSTTHFVIASYIQPLLLWIAALLICRVLDPVVLPTEASQVVKQRLLNFVRSLSTMLAFAICFSSVIQQTQKFFMESNEPSDTRNMGFQFAGKAVYSAVWVAAFSLFMELLGFSTQKWVTAGGLGTVLLTLAGREIFTNFLSSAMVHATRPFVVNEWIQTKIEGYEVSGTVEHVGWWSPTIVRGEDREAVHIPNHKFTMNVVRNLSQKTHWRIKTHLAISHLDVHKISNIVADMRKVLAKNPQVEQQRLHRRVFLDNVNPENQALLILVSCFVKTSHYEEYLCVKDAILLDLLRVISHHRARLATPIRTVQKIYRDTDLDNVPFADSIYNRRPAANRPLLLIEPSYKINGEDKTKQQTRSGRSVAEQDSKTTPRSTPDNKGVSSKPDPKAKESLKSDGEADAKIGDTSKSNAKELVKAAAKPASDPKLREKMESPSSANSVHKTRSNIAEVSDSNSLMQKKKQADGKQSKNSNSDDSSALSSGVAPRESGRSQDTSQQKQSIDGKTTTHPSASKPALEENIVLGVALEGSKRTLPIDEDTMDNPTAADPRETAATCQKGSANSSSDRDTKESQIPKKPNTASSDR